jgi:poly(A) polymerase
VGSAPFGLTEQPRFRAAFDFMRLRAENGEIDIVLSDWWQEFSMANDNLRNDMVDAVKLEQQQRARPTRAPRVHKVPNGTLGAAANLIPTAGTSSPPAAPSARQGGDSADAATNDGTEAPKKRRRRRRPTGRSAGDAPAQDPQA